MGTMEFQLGGSKQALSLHQQFGKWVLGIANESGRAGAGSGEGWDQDRQRAAGRRAVGGDSIWLISLERLKASLCLLPPPRTWVCSLVAAGMSMPSAPALPVQVPATSQLLVQPTLTSPHCSLQSSGTELFVSLLTQ